MNKFIPSFLSFIFRKFSAKCHFNKVFLCLLFACAFTCDAKEIFESYPELPERELPYRAPTERYIEYFGWENISATLKASGISLVHCNLFNRVSAREDLGLLGYHGSSQNFRIFEDILHLIVEEIVDIPVREDFQFFRIPGDPEYSSTVISKIKEHQLLYLNYSIYANHHLLTSSSYRYFTKNSSSSAQHFENHLKPLFLRLEIPIEMIDILFQIGKSHTPRDHGVILQLFDTSHYDPRKPYYSLADEVSSPKTPNLIFSKCVIGLDAKAFPCENPILMDHASTLNPFSSLVVMRYDGMSYDETKVYMEELRCAIKGLSYSREAAQIYKQELLSLWGQNDE